LTAKYITGPNLFLRRIKEKIFDFVKKEYHDQNDDKCRQKFLLVELVFPKISDVHCLK